jgi:hypothetical protein
MKKISFLIVTCLVFSFANVAHAQRIDLKSGSLASLSTLTELRVEYTYDNMTVGKMKEADYITKKVDEYNKKEPGKGDTWKQVWVEDRTLKFQPRFQDAFNSIINLTGVNFKIDPNSGSKEKMVVHTTFTEPGFNIYMTRKNASINLEVTFYDASGAEMAKVEITNSPGSGVWELDYDTGIRIQDAYANAGRTLAVMILDKAFGKK